MNSAVLQNLNEVFDRARAEVPFYRQLYEGIGEIRSLTEFAQLPTLTKSMLAAVGLERSISNMRKLCITRTYEDDPRSLNYMPKVLNYEDVIDDYSVLSFIMKPITDEGDQAHRIMLIGDEL